MANVVLTLDIGEGPDRQVTNGEVSISRVVGDVNGSFYVIPLAQKPTAFGYTGSAFTTVTLQQGVIYLFDFKRPAWGKRYYVMPATTTANFSTLTTVTPTVDSGTASVPGIELGFAEAFTAFTTTSAAYPGTIISSLTVGPIIGQGRPVDVDFYAPGAFHTTANAGVSGYILINDVALTAGGQVASAYSPSTTNGPPLIVRRRTILTTGTSYTFKVGIFGGVAGTSTVNAANFAAMQLSVTSR